MKYFICINSQDNSYKIYDIIQNDFGSFILVKYKLLVFVLVSVVSVVGSYVIAVFEN